MRGTLGEGKEKVFFFFKACVLLLPSSGSSNHCFVKIFFLELYVNERTVFSDRNP